MNLLSGYYTNSLPGEPSHFFYPISEITYRSLCEGWEVLRSRMYETTYVECQVCLGREDVDLEQDGIRISGAEPDLTEQEYRELFLRITDQGEELSYHLPAVKDLSPEELVDHVNLLTKFSIRVRIAKQTARVQLDAKRITLSEEHKKALKLRDMQYKPKPAPSEEKAPRAKRAAGTAKVEDAVENIMRIMGLTREQAEKRLAKAKSLLDPEDN